jgi:hypothetical protein
MFADLLYYSLANDSNPTKTDFRKRKRKYIISCIGKFPRYLPFQMIK